MFVKPAPARAVRDPMSRLLLPAEGAIVPESQFWHRRLLFGDVVLAAPPTAPARPVEAVSAAEGATARPEAAPAEAVSHEAPAEPAAEQESAR